MARIILIQQTFAVLNGLLYGFVWSLFLVLAVPLSVFFFIAKALAKLFRPDLDEIISGVSASFCYDYFAKEPPRSNLVVTLSFEGNITFADVKKRVLEKWINSRDTELTTGKPAFEKFRQYPVRWLGFNFWTKPTSFKIEDHVFRVYDNINSTPVSKTHLSKIVETLINSRLPAKKSPWEIHVIENYLSSNLESRPQSVIIFKVHHCLTDGTGIILALQTLFGTCVARNTPILQNASKPSWWQCISPWLKFPVTDGLHLFSRIFRNCPWLVPDSRKTWYQVCAKSQPVPIQFIKDIKNKTGVSFSSVIFAAISSAINKSLISSGKAKTSDLEKNGRGSMMCVGLLPLPDRLQQETLCNHFTTFVLDLPINGYVRFEQRLRKIDEMLQYARNANVPKIFPVIANIIASQVYPLAGLASKNKGLTLGVTNFPGLSKMAFVDGNIKLSHVDFTLGGFRGETGVCIAILSYDKDIIFHVCCEKAVMSREEAQQFVDFIQDDLNNMGSSFDMLS